MTREQYLAERAAPREPTPPRRDPAQLDPLWAARPGEVLVDGMGCLWLRTVDGVVDLGLKKCSEQKTWNKIDPVVPQASPWLPERGPWTAPRLPVERLSYECLGGPDGAPERVLLMDKDGDLWIGLNGNTWIAEITHRDKSVAQPRLAGVWSTSRAGGDLDAPFRVLARI